MSEERRASSLFHDALGIGLFALAIFVGVSVVMALFYGLPGPDADGTTALVGGTVALVGAPACLLLAAGLAILGARQWISGPDSRFPRHVAGLAGTALGLAILLGAFSAPGAEVESLTRLGGRIGAVTGGWVSSFATPFVGGALGLVLLLLPPWLAWVRPAGLLEALISKKAGQPDDLHAVLHRNAAEGVSTAEAEALIPPAPQPDAIDPQPSPTAPYPDDVRRRGEIPEGATPLRSENDRSRSQAHAVKGIDAPQGADQNSALSRRAAARAVPTGESAGAHLAEARGEVGGGERAAGAPAGQSAAPSKARLSEAGTSAVELERTPKPVEPPAPPIVEPPAARPALERAGASAEVPADEPVAEGSEAHAGEDSTTGLPTASWEQSDMFEGESSETGVAESTDEVEPDLDAAPDARHAEPVVDEVEEDVAEDEAEEEEDDEEYEDEEYAEDDSDEDEDEEAWEEGDEEEEAEDEDVAAEYEEGEEPEDEEEDAEYEEDAEDEEEDEEEEEDGGEGEEEPDRVAAELEEPEEPEEPEDEEEQSEEAEPEADAEREVFLQPRAPAEQAESDPVEAGPALAAGRHSEDLIFRAGCLILERNRVAVSLLQREFELDFQQATGVLDQLQRAGLIGPYLGGQRRDILMTPEAWREAVGAD